MDFTLTERGLIVNEFNFFLIKSQSKHYIGSVNSSIRTECMEPPALPWWIAAASSNWCAHSICTSIVRSSPALCHFVGPSILVPIPQVTVGSPSYVHENKVVCFCQFLVEATKQSWIWHWSILSNTCQATLVPTKAIKKYITMMISVINQ